MWKRGWISIGMSHNHGDNPVDNVDNLLTLCGYH